MPSLRCLHITDLHHGLAGMGHLWPNVEERVFEDLKYLHQSVGPWDLVLFTGDLVQEGLPDEFKLVDQLLVRMWGKFDEWGFQPKLLAVPGNHDLARPKPGAALTALTRSWDDQEVNKPFWEETDSEYRRLIDTAFANYTNWWDQTKIPKPNSYTKGILPGDFSATIEKERLKFGIVGLNSAFLHLRDDVEGKLAVDLRQFHAACGGSGPDWVRATDACLLMTHHPPDWLYPAAKQHFDNEIHSPPLRFALHLFGHMHEPGLRSMAEGGGDARRRLQGCSLFSNEPWGKAKTPKRLHGYSLVELKIEDDQGEMRFWPRNATEKQGGDRTIDRDQSFTLDRDDGGTNPIPFALLNLRGRARGAGAPAATLQQQIPRVPPYATISRLLRTKKFIPFVGPEASAINLEKNIPEAESNLPALVDLAQAVVIAAAFPTTAPPYVTRDLARVASFLALKQKEVLQDIIVEFLKARSTPGPLHRKLAAEKSLLLVTTNFDNLLEQAFDEINRPYHLLVSRGSNVLHRAPGKDFHDSPANRLKLNMENLDNPVIYKMCGSTFENARFYVTEEDHVELLNHKLFPGCFAPFIRKSSFLFLGCDLQDWNFRVMMRNIHDSYGIRADSYSIQNKIASDVEKILWDGYGVPWFDLSRLGIDFDEFAKRL